MQQRNEKVTEPSMEDILASIRKIISEEPAPTKTGPAAGAQRVAQPSTSPQAAQAAVSSPRPAVAETPRPAAPAAPAAPTPSASRLSDFVRELAPTAVPVGGPSTASFHDDLDDLVESETRPPIQEPAQNKQAAMPMPAPIEPPKAAQPRDPAVAPAQRPADLGAFIPSSAQSIGMSSPRPQALSIGPDLRAFDVPKPVSREFPAAPPATSRPIELGIPVPLADNKPVAEVEAPAADTAVADEVDPHNAAQKALGALAMGLATPGPAAVAPPASAIVPAASSAISSEAPVEPALRKSLDDTIVGMLRPMIGDWLDEHLPEMVEKALRQELSERGKSGS